VDQGGTPAVERIEIDGLIIRGALLPTPKEDTNPLERQSAYSGLMGFPLVALLLVIDPRPEGMPDRCGCPLDERLPQELWTLEAPVHPGLLATAFGHRRDPGIFLQGSVLDVEMAILDKQSKGVAIDEQANDDVVHLYRLREADRLAD
jgi:hypothetical protein